MFLIELTYKKSLNEVERLLGEHALFLEKYYSEGWFIFSGRKNPRTGGIILAHRCNREEIGKIIEEDPFYRNGIADYNVQEFIPTRYAEAFSSFVQ